MKRNLSLEWYKFSTTYEEFFMLTANFLPLVEAYNSHLYTHDGFTWTVYKMAETNNRTLFLKSNHKGLTDYILEQITNYEKLDKSPDLDDLTAIFGDF